MNYTIPSLYDINHDMNIMLSKDKQSVKVIMNEIYHALYIQPDQFGDS